MQSLPGKSSTKLSAFLCNSAGNVNVRGIDVSAPIRATKSLKNGIALETRYDDRDMPKVRANHRLEGSIIAMDVLRATRERSIDEQSA